MELIELINLLPQDNKDLVYKAYKIWFEILYEEYEYNESLVKEFIYDLYNQDIYKEDMTKHPGLNVIYRTYNKGYNDVIIYKFKNEKNSFMVSFTTNKLNNFINEYQ